MDFEFKLPDIGEGLVEGEIVKWFVKVGDVVAEHQPLAAVLTDKAEVEVPSPKAGTVAKLHGKPGEKVRVHAPLVTLTGVSGVSAPAARAETSPVAPAASQRAAARQTDVLATPMLRKLAR